MVMKIDCKGMYYRKLNRMIRDAVEEGETGFILDNVNGQRYIGNGINKKVSITINGMPGNDLAMFMNGPALVINANAQDGVANTMNAGEIIIHGSAGDVLGYGMRGGVIYIRGEVEEHTLGKEVSILDPDAKDEKLLKKHLSEYCKHFGLDLDELLSKPFIKLLPVSSRPYGNMYAY